MSGCLIYPRSFAGVIFDWDGVIARSRLDFGAIRAKFFGGARVPLLEGARRLPPDAAAEVMEAIRAEEMRGAAAAEPVEGARELIGLLEARGVPWCVMSRNCRESIDAAASVIGFKLPALVWSREARHVKPDARAFEDAASAMGVAARSCLAIGDFLYEMIGARRAGARCVLVNSADAECESYADACFARLEDFARSFAADEPIVPWEYHAALKERGLGALEAMSRATALLDRALDARTFARLETLARAGLGRVRVPEGRELSAAELAAVPGLSPRLLKESVALALEATLGARYPLLRVETGGEGTPLFSLAWGA